MLTKSLCPLMVLAVGCATPEHRSSDPEAPKVEQQVDTADMYVPGGLANLMRIMEAHGDSAKVAIAQGTELPSFPDAIDSLLTATPTEGMHIDPISFTTFAADYQNKVKELYEAQEADRGHTYDMVVRSCENCHHSHCPGPLMKIKKMYLP